MAFDKIVSIRTVILLFLLFVLTVPANADNISWGQIVVPDFFNKSFLNGRGFFLSNIIGGAPLGWFSNCGGATFCTMDQIKAIGSAGMLQFNSDFIRLNGNVVGFTGSPLFAATSFNFISSQFGLVVYGTAVGQGSFAICSPPGSGCTATGQVFTFSKKSWHYDADFVPDPHHPNLFGFERLTITTVPEPSTLLLLATGLGALGFPFWRLCR